MAGRINIETIENWELNEKYSGDLEEALKKVGLGWYNIKYIFCLTLFLLAAVLEPVGYSYLLPAAKCDLNLTEAQQGFIASIPYIGIVTSLIPWGYLVDTRGRKKPLVYSSLAAGLFGMLAGLMPEFYGFTLCKFMAALCTACAATVPYSYIGEILPQQHRDVVLSSVNCMQSLGNVLMPLFAMGILHFDFRIDLMLYHFRPWRLLCMVYSCLFVISAILMSFGPESPKFLVSQGKLHEALSILEFMYAKNTGKSAEEFPIKKIKITEERQVRETSFLASLKVQTVPLLRRPYLKWLALNGFLLFGVCCMVNGLYLWVPDVINRVFSSGSSGHTACAVITSRFNQNTSKALECNDSLDDKTFIISIISGLVCTAIVLPVSMSVKYMDKKILLILVFVTMAAICYSVNHITQPIVFTSMLLAVCLTGLAIGPVNAFTVEKFPTHLRGMAMSLTMLIGRSGSIVSANLVGLFISSACQATFNTIGGLCTVCALLGFLIPYSSSNKTQRGKQ